MRSLDRRGVGRSRKVAMVAELVHQYMAKYHHLIGALLSTVTHGLRAGSGYSFLLYHNSIYANSAFALSFSILAASVSLLIFS